MEKLYVNEIDPQGQTSTIGLFYSRAEAEAVVTKLRAVRERGHYRYEIVPATQRYLTARHSQRSHRE